MTLSRRCGRHTGHPRCLPSNPHNLTERYRSGHMLSGVVLTHPALALCVCVCVEVLSNTVTVTVLQLRSEAAFP